MVFVAALSLAGSAAAQDPTPPQDASTPQDQQEEPQQAQPSEGAIIEKVLLDGEVGVDRDLLRANLRTKAGAPFSQNTVDDDVRWLADSQGVLAEVRLLPGPTVQFLLSRIRRYDDVVIVGNVRYDEEELLGVARLKKGKEATPDQIVEGRELIKDKYLKAGYAFVQIDIRAETDKDNRRIAQLRVFEGPQVETDEVKIEGLTALDPDDALSVMRSPPGMWAWLVGKDFVASEVDADVVLLENFVRGEGYLDGRAAIKRLDWNEDRDEVTITMLVDEGPRYTVRSMRVEGNTVLTEEELLGGQPVKVGGPWRRPDVVRVLRHMKDLYGRKGYIDADIEPVETFDLTEPVLDVVWKVTEGMQKHVRDVIVRGNSGTKDEVVRRYITLYPGQVVDTSELKWSEDQIIAQNYFTDFSGAPQVRVDTEPAPDPSQVDVVADVNDEQSGLFSFLIGAGSDSGLFAGITINKYNFDLTKVPSSTARIVPEFFGSGEAFHGAGQHLEFRIEPGTRTTNIDITFRDPWLNPYDEHPWGLTTELYNRSRTFDDYEKETTGLGVSFDHKLSRQTTVSIGGRIEDVRIGDVDDELINMIDPPSVIAQAEGTSRSQALELGWGYQDIDSLYETTKGFTTALRLENAGNGLGGDIDLVRLQGTAEWFFPIHEDIEGHKSVLHPRVALGRVVETGSDDLPFFENYFVGGSTGPFALRGFDFQGVGPHESGNATGGKLAGVASVEALFPLISQYNPFRDEDDTILKGVLFFDAGNLVPPLGHSSDLVDDIRYGTGAGIRLRLPALGGIIVSVDYALFVHDQPEDEKRALSFELSRRF